MGERPHWFAWALVPQDYLEYDELFSEVTVTDSKTQEPQTAGQDNGTLQSRMVAGDLIIQDFDGLKRGLAAELVTKLATGSRDQRDNLVLLMSNPIFSEHLAGALNDMQPADRKRVLQTVGEVSESQVSQVRSTLTAALNDLLSSSLDETLRETILSRSTAALREVDSYLKGKPDAAASFLWSVSLDISLDDAKLSQLFGSMGLHSRLSALQGLAAGPDSRVHETFKRIGDAVYDSQNETMRAQLEETLDALSEALRNGLLIKVITDPVGTRPTDLQVNKGRRLVADYLDRKEVEGVRKFLQRASAPERPIWEKFIVQNVRNENVQRSLNCLDGYIDNSKVKTADARAAWLRGPIDGILNQYRYIRSVRELNDIELDRHLASLSPQEVGETFKLFFKERYNKAWMLLVPTNILILSHTTTPWGLEIISRIVNSSALASKAKFAAGLAYSFQNERPKFNYDKSTVRTHIANLLNKNVNGVLLELAPSELKNIVKVYMHPPADMSLLKKVLSDLTPQFSAKLARAVHSAAIEVAAETKAGRWVGDVLKGLTISGKVGRSSSVKSGDAKLIGGERTAGISAEIGFSWTPASLVEGERARAGDQITAEFNGFMLDWMLRLNSMSPNQKAIFLEEMKDSVKVIVGL